MDTGTVDLLGTIFVASDGIQSIDLNGTSAGSISQTINGFNIGDEYTLYFDIAGHPSGAAIKELEASIDGVTQSFQFDSTGSSPGDLGWVRESLSFTASSTSTTLSFASLNGAASPFGATLDNVFLVNESIAVPLPAGVWFLLSGLGIFGLMRRRSGQAA